MSCLGKDVLSNEARSPPRADAGLIAPRAGIGASHPLSCQQRPLHKRSTSFAALYRLRTFAPKYGEYETEGVAPPCWYPPISPQAELPLIIHGDPEVPLG